MEFKSNVKADCCTPTGKYELCGCAGGVPYIQLTVVGGGVVQTAWLNTETGDTFTTKPAGFLTGTCQDALLSDVLKFSATAPTASAPFTAPKDGHTTIVTADGTATGAVVGLYLYDEQTATWKLIPTVAAGGNIGDVYTKLPDGSYGWAAPATQAIFDNQVLTGGTGTNTTVTMTPVTVTDESGGTQVNYTVTATAKIDGTTIVEDPATKVLSASNQKPDVLTTAQPTPTPTGNTTNLNSVFKDASGSTWFVDYNGDAVLMGSAPFKELNRFYVDPNGLDANTGANEAPKLTVQAAVSLLAAGDIAIVNEGVYTGAVTLSVANTSLAGADGAVNSLTQIASLAVTTASGTSNKVSDLTILGAVTHSGGAPLYLHSVTVGGNYTSTSTAYEEINDCRIQDGTITKTTTGTLYIKDSLIGNATFNTPNQVISLDNVSIDVGDVLTIGAGVVYMLNDVRGTVNIDPAAIPLAVALQGAGATAAVAKAAETATFNDIRLTNVPTVATATKVLVRDALGVVCEQLIPVGAAWTDATANPTETGNIGFLPRFVSNTVTGDKWYIDTSGVAKKIESGTGDCGTVYFDGTDPATATIFDTANPPVTNDNALKLKDCAIYIGTDGSIWSSNGTTYATKVYSVPTEQYTAIFSTAGQTTYTLPSTPIGGLTLSNTRGRVHVTRNGVDISRAWSWTGAVGTYITANNFNCTIDAGDLLQFHWEAY